MNHATQAVYAQGDVLLVPTTIPTEAVQSAPGRITLALGEASGHAHVIDEPSVIHYTMKDAANDVRAFLRVVSDADVRHVHGDALTGEHSTVTLPPGDYEAIVQTVWAGEVRRAAD